MNHYGYLDIIRCIDTYLIYWTYSNHEMIWILFIFTQRSEHYFKEVWFHFLNYIFSHSVLIIHFPHHQLLLAFIQITTFEIWDIGDILSLKMSYSNFKILSSKRKSAKWVILINLPKNFDLNFVYLHCMGTCKIFGQGETIAPKISIFYIIRKTNI